MARIGEKSGRLEGKHFRREGENNKVNRLVSWNLAGIYKAKKAADYLEGFNIVILQESWVER